MTRPSTPLKPIEPPPGHSPGHSSDHSSGLPWQEASTNRAILDDFSVARSPGKVIGTQSVSGHTRQGADAEKVLAIDNGALRIRPLINPGWGRSGIAYGPYKREPGLAMSVFMLNGHNVSEGNSIEETFKGRFFRWLRGSEANSIGNRLVQWTFSAHHRNRLRLFYRWLRNPKSRFKDGHIKENLAVGWFPKACPTDPTATGNAIVIRAYGPENSELCTQIGSAQIGDKADLENGEAALPKNHLTPAFRRLQNLQAYYVVVLREQGAAYYAAAMPNAHGFSAYPYMRLVGIDAWSSDRTVYAGLYQSALGQVGFQVDSRVYGIHTEVLPNLSPWYGTAQAADRLTGNSSLDQSAAELGGRWRVVQGAFQRTTRGASAQPLASPISAGDEKIDQADVNLALLENPAPAGAIHVLIIVDEPIDPSPDHAPDQPADQPDSSSLPECALLWRTKDENNTWALCFENGQCQLKIREGGQWSQIDSERRYGLNASSSNAVQILDQGDYFSLYLNGNLLFDEWFTDLRFRDETNMGLLAQRAFSFQSVESHPRDIPIPPALRMGEPWQAKGAQVLVSDSFGGSAGQDIAGRLSEVGQQWRKEIGSGRILLTGRAAQVEASAASPNPKRLAYTVPWSHPEFADVSVDILPPGTDRHQQEKGRGGLIFWQDADNYITVSNWLDDTFNGSSMSSFFHIDGFEEIYDAVWSNLGDRISWGKRYTLRITFDGLNFIAYVDGEPVLYRSLQDVYPRLSRLSINRIGLVANWEWGDDTGSAFSRFVAKG